MLAWTKLLERTIEIHNRLQGDRGFRERFFDDPTPILAECGIRKTLDLSAESFLSNGSAAMPELRLSDVILPSSLPEDATVASTPEFLRLAFGKAHCALFQGSRDTILRIAGAARKRGWIYALGALRCVPQYDQCDSFSNVHIVEPISAGGGDRAQYQLVVANDAAQLCLAWLCCSNQWHRPLGLALGYPACCVDAFARKWDDAVRQYHGDLTPFIIEASQGATFPSCLNFFPRLFGLAVMQHFPCSFHCRESADLARCTLDAMQSSHPDLHRKIERLQASAVLYTRYAGVHLLTDYRAEPGDDEWVIHYRKDAVISSKNNRISDFLSRNSALAGHITGGRWAVGDDGSADSVLLFANA